ncbi:helix-turn-helix domain-containing protein [Actinoallomurus spadix]|uniref:Helix-turn-helix transcriptional regulator n=1 Tax=Actinoallomurus spadix TaxID=79912 RepID=A0ABN0XIP3_9ACTN|nr:helix-turn-helix domain-containing protein [Actinoallomurus spadix]MCO5987548.1 helix-turn-helix domain-containing protein [Actinoallomurus spadix]
MNGSDTGSDTGSVYWEVAPAEPHPFARCRWEQRVDERVDGYVQRVLPDACADVIVSVDGSAVVVGAATEPVLPWLRGGERLRGLRIRPAMIGVVLGLPAYELRDLQVPLGEVFPAAEAGRIADAVRRGRPWPSAVARRPEDRRAEYAVRRLMGTGARVAGIAEEAGLSERQLRRLILARTGLEPRTLRRVARLQRFLALSDRAGTLPGPERSLAGLAAAAGYADQAHLSREVRALAGLTPSGLLAERRASGGGAAPAR